MNRITSIEDMKKQQVDAVIKAYKHCMAQQFHSYILLHGGFPQEQWRDTIRTFFMAWYEALRWRDQVAAHYCAEYLGQITLPNWYPSDEWRFW